MIGQLRKKTLFFISIIVLISLSCGVFSPTSNDANSPEIIHSTDNLVGRSPLLWMPKPSEFGSFGNIQPEPYSFTNIEYSDYQTDSEKFKVLSQAGRIISYGYEWFAEYCDDALMLDVSAAYISTALYNTSNGASAGYNFFYNQNKQVESYEMQTDVGIGDESMITYGVFDSCNSSANFIDLDFRVYNVTGYVSLTTLDNLSRDELQMQALELGRKLESAIRKELSKNPGSPDSLYIASFPEKNLIWRNPNEWIGTPETFNLFSNTPFIGNFSYNNSTYIENAKDQQKAADYVKDTGRVINSGYRWGITYCDEYRYTMINYGNLIVTMFDSQEGARLAFDMGRTSKSESSSLISQKNVQLGEGQGIISISEINDCNMIGRRINVYFQRYNVTTSISFETFFSQSDVSESQLSQFAIDVGNQLDQLIINEAIHHPGSLDALVLVRNSAETVLLNTDSSAFSSDGSSSVIEPEYCWSETDPSLMCHESPYESTYWPTPDP